MVTANAPLWDQLNPKLATKPAFSAYPYVGKLQIAALAGFCFVFGTSFFQVIFSSNSGASAATERSPSVYASFLLCYFITLIFCIRSFKWISMTLMSFLVMSMLLFYPFVSTLWSQTPFTTLQRSVAVAGCSLLGVYLASVFSLRSLVRLLAYAACVMALVHVIISLLVPSIGVMDASWEATGVYAGAWRGLTTHKNMLGAYSSLNALILLFAVMTFNGKLRWLYLAGFFLSLLALYEARSTTAILILFACIFTIILMRSCQYFPNLLWPAVIILVIYLPIMLVSIFTENFLGEIFVALDKNPQMSGRFPLWDLAILRVNERFWLGYGHETFWNPDDLYVRYIEERLRYSPHYSHNGVVETLLNGGFFLLSLLIIAYMISIYNSIRLVIMNPRSIVVIFPICFMVLFFLANLTESHILARNSLIWTLFVAIAFATALELRNSKSAQ